MSTTYYQGSFNEAMTAELATTLSLSDENKLIRLVLIGCYYLHYQIRFKFYVPLSILWG